jgi:membrane protein DedA with SNARE-associated domain
MINMDKEKLKITLKLLSIPLGLIIIALLYTALWKFLGWPMGDELINIAKGFFQKYGLWLVFFSSICEGILLAGNYFPGGIVIFFSVVAAGKHIPKATLTVSVVILGFFIAYFINYLLGKYGWHKLLVKFGLKDQLDSAQAKIQKHNFKAIMSSYWFPNLGAVTSTAAGVLNIPAKRFLIESLIGLLIWDAIWGTIVYILGDQALKLITNVKLLLPIGAIWILSILIYEYVKKKRVTNITIP